MCVCVCVCVCVSDDMKVTCMVSVTQRTYVILCLWGCTGWWAMVGIDLGIESMHTS